MGKHNIGLLTVTVVSVLLFINTLGFNALAGAGIYPFLENLGNISDAFDTEISPAGWTFSIWSIIYIWLTLMLLYFLSGLCRRNAYGYVYCSPPVLSYGFFITWCLNMGLNVGWLFLWDRSLMIPAVCFLLMIACTNCLMIAFSCHGLHIYGAWLNKYHKVDLWLLRVLVQNGIAMYATWTTIATLVNLTIVLTYDAKMLPEDAATTTLSILTGVLFFWFVLENGPLDKHVRYIVTIYPVVIWSLGGIMSKKYDADDLSQNNIFTVGLLASVCVLFATKILLAIMKHIKQPLYKDARPEAMSPMEIAKKQKYIFY